MTNKTLKIGLDFHGVINKQPDYFAEFTKLALQRGHEIHIITGGPCQTVEKLLHQWNICYTNIFAILDYYNSKGEVTYFENGEFKVSPHLWDTAKASYCSDNGINIHIDDSTSYVKWFLTPYCRYDEGKQICSTDNATIDFHNSPLHALQNIENIISAEQFF